LVVQGRVPQKTNIRKGPDETPRGGQAAKKGGARQTSLGGSDFREHEQEKQSDQAEPREKKEEGGKGGKSSASAATRKGGRRERR